MRIIKVFVMIILSITSFEKVYVEYVLVTKTGEDVLNTYEVIFSIMLIVRIFAS